ncbi:MAG: hypothetical protein JWM96_983 [Alphaproteobacteria bacterium]|nr:hypothetical protein [Alphaproteobacteria bacterium]
MTKPTTYKDRRPESKQPWTEKVQKPGFMVAALLSVGVMAGVVGTYGEKIVNFLKPLEELPSKNYNFKKLERKPDSTITIIASMPDDSSKMDTSSYKIIAQRFSAEDRDWNPKADYKAHLEGGIVLEEKNIFGAFTQKKKYSLKNASEAEMENVFKIFTIQKEELDLFPDRKGNNVSQTMYLSKIDKKAP